MTSPTMKTIMLQKTVFWCRIWQNAVDDGKSYKAKAPRDVY